MGSLGGLLDGVAIGAAGLAAAATQPHLTGAEAAVYRMTTRVRLYDWLAKTYPTFTLPRYVDLG